MARRPFVAGNWKLHLAPRESGALASALRARLADRGPVDVAVFPTALSLTTVVDALTGSGIDVGIQDIVPQPSGAFTGANSGALARAAGCTHVLVGHSERRTLFGETDASVNAKIVAALAAGLLPIVCVGETLAERDAGRVDAVVHAQLAGALDGLHADQIGLLTVAYEPVWAIGTGRTASPAQAQEVHASLRAWLRAHHPAWVADEIRIQYGGSVNARNASELLACPDIDGALVGGASLDADAFRAIVFAAGA